MTKITAESPSCLKESEFYYPGCFHEYKDAFIECESSSDCVGIIKHFADPPHANPRYYGAKHAPGGYYLCRQTFTISELFFEKKLDLTNRPNEVYKKKKGKGINNFCKFNSGKSNALS